MGKGAGLHPNSLANLKKGTKFGENGRKSPGGSKKKGGSNFKQVAKEVLKLIDEKDGGTGEYSAPLVKRLWIIIARIDGKDSDALAAIKLLLDRIEGPVPTKMHVTEENPLSEMSDADLEDLLREDDWAMGNNAG